VQALDAETKLIHIDVSILVTVKKGIETVCIVRVQIDAKLPETISHCTISQKILERVEIQAALSSYVSLTKQCLYFFHPLPTLAHVCYSHVLFISLVFSIG